jgi:hypothetical protein
MTRTSDPRVQAAILASKWAIELDLPIGNLWEPGICRAVEASWREYGADAEAWRLVEQEYRYRFGLGL